MTMNIDGYVPADKEVALEQGVTFHYDLDFGSITIRSKILDRRDNPKFGMALKVHEEWMERRKRLNKGATDEEAERRFLGMIHDHGVIDWSTTIKSDGKTIVPTRENFIDLLMANKKCEEVAVVYFQDATDEANFRAVSREEDEGNSAPPSAGKASGRGGEKHSSDT